MGVWRGRGRVEGRVGLRVELGMDGVGVGAGEG